MASTDDDPTAAAREEAKARFREALAKKNAARHRHDDGKRNTGSVHGSETSGPTQKMFRRKSG